MSHINFREAKIARPNIAAILLAISPLGINLSNYPPTMEQVIISKQCAFISVLLIDRPLD